MSYDFDLGPWSRRITTRSEIAQQWFDRGLNWTYAYNHEEAVACFLRAAEADPGAAMPWWGVAYARGPFYNRPWIRYADAEIADVVPGCHQAIAKALSLMGDAAPEERGLIQALERRYRNGEERDEKP